MPAQWLSSTSEFSDRVSASLESVLRDLSQPARARRLRWLLSALLLVWVAYSLASLIWALYPGNEQATPEAKVINPVSRPTGAITGGAQVDVEQMRGWHLFGEAGAMQDLVATPVEVVTPDAREGIEKDARETRLQLLLRGALAASEDGLGHAIIEYRNKQAVYAVEDKLPVSGQVTLAKVMARQVVLDNGGTYELLTLYEESELDGQARNPGSSRLAPARRSAPSQVDKRSEVETTSLALGYRDRLYENPQSLAEVVNVNAVRVEGELLGYRISPGKDKGQFSQMGFQSGDLVTSINGISLDDPANTMRLYQTMRSATEAVFELQRGGQPVSLSVSLEGTDE